MGRTWLGSTQRFFVSIFDNSVSILFYLCVYVPALALSCQVGAVPM